MFTGKYHLILMSLGIVSIILTGVYIMLNRSKGVPQVNNYVQKNLESIKESSSTEIPKATDHIPVLNIFNKTDLTNHVLSLLKCNNRLIPIFISKFGAVAMKIKFDHSWESLQVEYLMKFSQDFEFHFIDIGCNLGVYSLNMACRGHDVIAIEANIEVVKIFSHSIKKNNFTNKIVLLHNAVTNSRDEFEVKVYQNEDPIGKIRKVSGYSTNLVRGIFMDDVIPLIKHKNVIIKIDIEGSEISAFRKAEELFKNYKVLMVVMEWAIIKHNVEVEFVLNFMKIRNYSSYSSKGDYLSLSSFMNWPIEVFWKLDKL